MARSTTYPPAASRPAAPVQATTYVCPAPTGVGGEKLIVGVPGTGHVPATVKLTVAVSTSAPHVERDKTFQKYRTPGVNAATWVDVVVRPLRRSAGAASEPKYRS